VAGYQGRDCAPVNRVDRNDKEQTGSLKTTHRESRQTT
jgi:hypothetical protein